MTCSTLNTTGTAPDVVDKTQYQWTVRTFIKEIASRHIYIYIPLIYGKLDNSLKKNNISMGTALFLHECVNKNFSRKKLGEKISDTLTLYMINLPQSVSFTSSLRFRFADLLYRQLAVDVVGKQ